MIIVAPWMMNIGKKDNEMTIHNEKLRYHGQLTEQEAKEYGYFVLARTKVEYAPILVKWNKNVNIWMVYKKPMFFNEGTLTDFEKFIDTPKNKDSISRHDYEKLKDIIKYEDVGYVYADEYVNGVKLNQNPKGENMEILSEQDAMKIKQPLFAKTVKEGIPCYVEYDSDLQGWSLEDNSGFFPMGTLYHFTINPNVEWFGKHQDEPYTNSDCEDLVIRPKSYEELEKERTEKNVSDKDKIMNDVKKQIDDMLHESTKHLFTSITDEKGNLKPNYIVKDDSLDESEYLYHELNHVLKQAYNQAASGKGKERHGNGKEFTQQPMFQIADMLGSNHFMIGQAVKKAQESTRMDKDRAIRELLGSIVYLAGAVIYLENKSE